jgi:hypothetical protein
MYQVLKFASFEGDRIYYGLGLVTVLIAGLALLPFLDRGKTRQPKARPYYTTIGLVLIGELAVLTVWGYATPGQVISDASAAEVLGTAGIIIAAITLLILKARIIGRIGTAIPRQLHVRALLLPFNHHGTTALFAIPLIIGSVAMANVANAMMTSVSSPLYVTANSAVLIVSFYVMLRIMRSLTQAQRRSRLCG